MQDSFWMMIVYLILIEVIQKVQWQVFYVVLLGIMGA